MRCSNCGYENLEGNNFCSKCGASIADTSSVSVEPIKKKQNPTFIILVVVGSLIILASIIVLIYSARNEGTVPHNIPSNNPNSSEVTNNGNTNEQSMGESSLN